MTPHYPKLREYFIAVAKDAIRAGKIRAVMGVSVKDAVAGQGRVLLAEIESDIIALVTEFGLTALDTAPRAVEKFAGQMVEKGASALKQMLAEALLRPGKKPQK